MILAESRFLLFLLNLNSLIKMLNMKKSIIILSIFVLGIVSGLKAQLEYYIEPYYDFEGYSYNLAWEASTGNSMMYYWDVERSDWATASVNLPSKPVPGSTGKIMIEPYIDLNGTSYYLAWDCSTGKSQLYFWSTSDYVWVAAEINLPENPVPGATGNIMLDPYMDFNGTGYCMTWAENTGKSQLYYWNGETASWDALPINLPEKPVPGATGKIMTSNYTSQYGTNYSLAWDISTGKSQLYTWNFETSTWDALPVNLPASPVPGGSGNIMLRPYRDQNNIDYCLAWAESGKSILYYWNSETSTWDAAAVNLPEKPVSGATGKIQLRPYMDSNYYNYVLAFDKSTGKSQLYYWNIEESSWTALPVNLPATPVGK